MEKVTLQFETLDLLWAFTRAANVKDFKVDATHKRLVCIYEERLVTEALVYFNAKVVYTK